MRILVTGSNGMLGTSVKKVFSQHDLIMTSSKDLDVRNINQVMGWAKAKPQLILHLAAETDLVKAEFNPSDAYMTNHTGTLNITELATSLNIPIVYIGTAGIFDGAKDSYTEKDNANPLHHYGRSKYYGELVLSQYPKHYIVRSGWAMGGGPEVDKKFINKVYNQIKTGAKKLYGISDVFGSPTFTMDFAKTLKNIVEEKPKYGIYHSSGKGRASRLDVLKNFINLLGLSRKIAIIPMTNQEYLDTFPSQYPKTRSEVLSIKKIEKTGLSAMRDWREALFDYSKEFTG